MVYVALLRAVNVGGRAGISMAKLKETFEHLGFENVRTVIASGNVIFKANGSAEQLSERIENAIAKDFKMNVKVLLKDLPSIERIVKAIPKSWVNDAKTKCDVMFLWKSADSRESMKSMPFDSNIEDSKYVPGAILWRIDRKVAGKSKIFRRVIGSDLHKQMTIRNPNTVRKFHALMRAAKKKQEC